MGLWKLRGRSVATLASVVALTATGTMAINAALAPDPINGCVSKLTGGVRILTNGQSCNGLENPISWNTSGPAGPQGPQGTQGAQGPQGERGPAGPPGQTNSYLDNHPDPVLIQDANGAERIREISGWDVPAGSYQIEARTLVEGSRSSTSPAYEEAVCQIRVGTTVLKEERTGIAYPRTSVMKTMQTQIKLDAPSHVQLGCYVLQVGLATTAQVSQTVFQLTGLGTTRGL